MSININKTNIMMFLISITPIIDSVNGVMVRSEGSGLNIGQVFRILILLLLFLHVSELSKEDIILYWGCFALYIPIQFAVGIDYGISSVLWTIKLFMPLLMTVTMFTMINNNRINKESIDRMIDVIALLAPITIIIPFLLKVGYRTYETAGYRGFYFATNEINFVLAGCILICVHRLSLKIEMKSIVLLALNTLGVLLLGAKSGLVLAGSGIIFFAIYDGRGLRELRVRKAVVSLLLVFAAVLGVYALKDNLMDIISRLSYVQRQHSNEGALYMITSGRTARIADSWREFSDGSACRFLFGWGLGGVNNGRINVEMDFIDLLYAVGLIGIVPVILLYFRLIRTIRWDLWKIIAIVWTIILIAMGGHILYAALGGTMLSVLLIYLKVSETIRS